jgi:two-component system, OmpR family, sensor kinase
MAAAAVLVMITSVVMGFLGTVLLRGYLCGQADSQLLGFASVISRESAPPKFQHEGPAQLPSLFLIEGISANGPPQVLRGSVPGVPPPQLPAARVYGSARPFTAAAAGDPGHSWRVLVKQLPGGGHVVIAYNLDSLNSTVTRLEIADAAAGAAALLLLAALVFPLVRVSLAPLTRIETAAEAIAAGDLSRRIDHAPADTEVGRLAAVLNTMLGRIEAAYRAREEGEARARHSEERMRQFVADASHELRTPLTSVRGLAEFSLQQGETATRADLARMMALIHQEAIRMGLLVEDLLFLARLDEDRPLDRRPVDLSSAAAEAVQVARASQHSHPIALLAGPEPVIVSADSARLRQVIDNLISNAVRHTPPGTAVTVTVDAIPGHGQLLVTDNGPGMTAEQASRIFERFYRTDPARTRARGGTGLGLSIAAALVNAHRGTITVSTQPGHGATFRVRLPLTAASGLSAERTHRACSGRRRTTCSSGKPEGMLRVSSGRPETPLEFADSWISPRPITELKPINSFSQGPESRLRSQGKESSHEHPYPPAQAAAGRDEEAGAEAAPPAEAPVAHHGADLVIRGVKRAGGRAGPPAPRRESNAGTGGRSGRAR